MKYEADITDIIAPYAPRKRWFPNETDLSFGLTLSKSLNRSIKLMREQISRFPKSEQRWAFEIGLRKAYARRRYYKRHFGKNREFWGR